MTKEEMIRRACAAACRAWEFLEPRGERSCDCFCGHNRSLGGFEHAEAGEDVWDFIDAAISEKIERDRKRMAWEIVVVSVKQRKIRDCIEILEALVAENETHPSH